MLIAEKVHNLHIYNYNTVTDRFLSSLAYRILTESLTTLPKVYKIVCQVIKLHR